jgi:predicted  nucleic acid-binding Zn-ribbon protein
MEKLSVEKKLGIIKQYFSGLSYDEIAAKTRISKGSIANIITELKAGKFPEALTGSDQIELLRELSLDLKQSKLTPGQCIVGIAVLNRIKECGLEPADIDRWPLILKSVGNAEQVPEFIRSVYDIQAVMKNKSMTLEDLHDNVLELEKKAAALEPMAKQCEDYKKQIAELSGQRDNLAVSVSPLKKEYELLNPRVKDLRERERGLSDRVKDLETRAAKAETSIDTGNKEKKSLLEMGLPLEALPEFNDRVQSVAHRHHIGAAEMKDRLFQELQRLDEGLTLEALVEERRHRLAELEKAIDSANQEKGALSSVVSDLKQEKLNLETGIKNTREKIVGELAKLIPVTKETVNGFLVELRQDRGKALDEMSRLRDETLEVGKEIGKYEATLQVNQWLRELLALVQGDESVEGKRVRAIALLVLRGIAAWLIHDKGNNLATSSPLYYTENLITEFERWQV